MANEVQTIPTRETGILQLHIGRDPDERLNWALKFAQRNLDGLVSWYRGRLRWEVYFFAVTPIFWWNALPAYYRRVLRPTFGSAGPLEAIQDEVPTDDDL